MYNYKGKLGSIYKKDCTKFILWAPTSSKVSLVTYNEDNINKFNMEKGKEGEWSLTLDGNLKGVYYNYETYVYGEKNIEVDPYAKAVSVNGEKSMVVDLEITNPKGWDLDEKPNLVSIIDSILYEMHIRDFSIDENSGVERKNKGKYLGLVEEGTKLSNSDVTTTLDHLKDLGITHVHLLPVFDYKSVNEAEINSKEYNWGYDPQNFNSLEGSYSTNPFNGEVRISEFKEAILKLHKSGIRVVMDVVYNHTFETEKNCLNLAVPYYYHRTNENNSFSDGSGCGNETASERSMFRRYMIDSVKYFAQEYHIDGFRFDLMAVHDIETMKEIRKALDSIDESIIIYGEGWNGGNSSLPKEQAAFKINISKYNNMQIACFSDEIRDAIKGYVFIAENKGFVNGGSGKEELIKSGIIAGICQATPGVTPGVAWANEPYQTINYDSAHDNYTLWDKLNLSCKYSSKEDLIKMNMLAASIVLLSQGIPFLHSGEEFLRTKSNEYGMFVENSYKCSDLVNKIDWNRKKEYIEVFNYYKGLIEVRKAYTEFRLGSADKIREKLRFLIKGKDFYNDQVVGFRIKDKEDIIVIFNSNNYSIKVNIPNGKWGVLSKGSLVGTNILEIINGDNISVEPLSTCIIKNI
ncbi:MAG: type I pullulanase [Clostridium sp.]